MTSKSCGSDIITVIYYVIFDFPIYTGSGGVWNPDFWEDAMQICVFYIC